MPTLIIQAKYALGDRVRFDSPTQNCAAAGTVYGITVYAEGPIDYLIQLDGDPFIQPGIQEDEISYLDADVS